MPEGTFELGFELNPLTESGHLDNSLDFAGGRRRLERDPLYNLASKNREKANDLVKEGNCQEAIGKYTEAIMQLRSCEGETDVEWCDESRLKVRQLRATIYLNLSLCFLKLEQWQHASNTATRALQGDKNPPDPHEDVLEPAKKVKALFRRASAQCEGFGNFEKALADLKKAHEFDPTDGQVLQMMKKCQIAVSKVTKKADKKMTGFLKKAQEEGDGGLFDESLRPKPEEKKPSKPVEPFKVKDGLFWMPGNKEDAPEAADNKDEGNGEIDYAELTREINEMREDNPKAYQAVREKLKEHYEAIANEAGEEMTPSELVDAALAEKLERG